MSNLLSRKFIISVIAISMAFYLTVVNKLPIDQFMSLLLGILVTYSTANVAQKFIKE